MAIRSTLSPTIRRNPDLVARVAQPGDDLRNLEDLGSHERHHHVDLIGVGGCKEHVAGCDSRLFEHRDGGAVAAHDLDVESIVELVDQSPRLFDQHHVVTVGGETLRKGRTHEPATDNNDFHWRSLAEDRI